jgi:glutathione S-transferase
MKKHIPSIAILCLAILFTTDALNAQVTEAQRERRRQMFGDLLKSLIESQMERNPVQPPPGRPNLRPFPGHDHRPTQPLTPNMTTARAQCEVWERESTQLVAMLRKEEQRLPRVRPLLADALTCHAEIKSLRANMGRVHSLEPLTDSFCRIDSQWRLLNHKLSRINGLRPECTACMARISEFDTQMCGLFDVQPQFNRRELSRYCTLMASGFQHLIQDIRYDMRGSADYDVVMGKCQRIYARLNEADRLISRGNYDSIVNVYNQCLTDWRKVKYKLVSCPHGRIQRDVHQIETYGAHIAELMWIQPDIDREYLRRVIGGMDREVAVAFKQVSLHDILNCKTPAAVLACSREFQNQCGRLSARLKTDADVESLMWDFKQFSNQWTDLNTHLSGFKGPRIARSIGQIDSGFQVLQGTFGDGPLIDRATMADICSELDQLSYQMIGLVEHHTGHGYEQPFHEDICGYCRSFHSSIHQMHEHVLADRRHDAHAAEDVAACVTAWGRLRPLIKKCKPEHRRQLQQLRARIEPLMVKLQVIFAS